LANISDMRKTPVLTVTFLLLFLSGIAQRKQFAVKDEITPVYDSIFSSLKWRNIGPFRGGRSNAVSGVKGNDQLYYAGYTGGGLWRTDDAGISWRNISDGQFNTSTIGDIAVSESDPNVIYVGTGEHAVRGVMTSYGDGVYRSLNGGRTWKHLGLNYTRHISDVVIHPSNSEIIFVAAQGALHGNNSERGVYKSVDGGATWKKTLYINDSTGISSLAIDVTNPRILYAASWQHRRLPWSVLSGGEGCGIWKSEDGGESWKKINNGLPKEMGKIGVSVSKANPSRVFAIVEAEKSKAGVYRSDDGGRTWSHLSNNQDLTARSWYYMEVFADPLNEDLVYVLNAPMMKSIDGGKTWSRIRVGHGDTHDLWINPSNPRNMILGDDGGAEISFNGGQTWSTLMNQPTAQFYRVNTDNKFPYKVYGGQQDNTSVIIKSRTNSGAIDVTDWMVGAGCECAYQAFDPNDPTHVYGGCYQGYIEVLDVVTREGKDVQAYPSLNLAVEPKKMKYRFNWNAPIVASPHDPKTIYHAANVVLRTTNGGIKWDQISGDLTRNDSTKQGSGGGPMTNEGAGGENYNTIMYLIESPLEKGVIWTGSDCGLVHITTDGGRSWKNVTPAGLPECLINSIEVSPHEKGVAYVAATRYKFNDFGSYAYKTSDYGKTWVKINTGIQADDFLRVIREDQKRKGFLYGGAERGFYVSDNGGSNWQKMQLNLPNVPVTDLTFRDNDLVASTAGRAFWILDDLSSLQQFRYAKTLTLFKSKAAYKYGSGPLPGMPDPYVGTSAPGGVILDYYMPEDADTNDVKLEIINATGKLVRTYSNKKDPDYSSYPGGPAPKKVIPASKGMNRFLWDLRGEQVQDVKGVFIYGDYRGNSLAPGNYKARLFYKGASAETDIVVLADPNLKVDAAVWNEQQQILERIDKDLTEMHVAVNNIRKARKQVQSLNDNLKDMPQYKSLSDEGNSLVKAMEAWEKNIVEDRITNGQDVINWPSKLNAEFFNIRSLANAHDPRITDGVRTRLADLEAEWGSYKKQYDTDLKNSVNAYNKKYREADVPAIMIR
jgi:photosystem II stability/assembly factor-like uncharacterized protein